jgi:hypothetical protein
LRPILGQRGRSAEKKYEGEAEAEGRHGVGRCRVDLQEDKEGWRRDLDFSASFLTVFFVFL